MKITDHFDRLPEAVKKTIYEKNGAGSDLPDALKTGIQALSGVNVADVRVHYNLLKPVQMNAESYAIGNDIHIAPGQEKHLPHEAWHLVQQKQGRVKPSVQTGGIAIDDDTGLEREADLMGARALQLGAS